jgi:hypothetical protein
VEDCHLATVTVYGGDFKPAKTSYFFKQFSLKSHDRRWLDETIPLDRLATLETISLESDGRNTLSTVGRALVGDLLAGPFGAIIAAGTAKGRNQVTFLAIFDDNRQFMGSTDSETFKSWTGHLLTKKRRQEKLPPPIPEREDAIDAEKVTRADALIARYLDEQKAGNSIVGSLKSQLAQSDGAPTFGKRKSF